MHNILLKEPVMITPSGFFEFLNKDKGECVLRDNPKFTSRTRNADTNAKNRWNSALLNVADKLANENPENVEVYLDMINKLNTKVVIESNSALQYHDEILGYTLLSSTLVEKIGYVTYFKEFMTWYDLSERLVDLLSIMTGTSPDIIECFLTNYLKRERPELSVKEFSREVLSGRYIPAGFMIGLLDNLCPTVNNFFKGLITIGSNNNYIVRGRENLMHQQYNVVTGQEATVTDITAMTTGELIDCYLCSVMRLLCYYIFQKIYNTIHDKFRPGWDADTVTGKIQHSTLLTGWSHADLVFQNAKKKDFPIITLRGRNDLTMDIVPTTCNIESIIEAYLKGELYL